MTSETIYAKLLEVRSEFGGYLVYIFMDLNTKYPLRCLRLPNWNLGTLKPGDSGYLTFQEVEAGKDFWFDRNQQKEMPYAYDNIFLMDFIIETKKRENNLVF